MKKLIIIAGAAVLSTGAFAGTFIANWSLPAGDSAYVTTSAYNGSAGMFTGTRVGAYPGPGGSDTSLAASVNTFCVELGEYITGGYNPSTHNVTLLTGLGGQFTDRTSGPNVEFDVTRTLRLRKLWNNNILTSGTDRAAFQVAQWNLMFDTDLDLSLGTFTGGGAVQAQAQAMLNNLDSLSAGTTQLYLLSKAGYQDQLTNVYGRPPGESPEPFTMGLGIAAAGVFVRRRMKAKKA